MKNRMSISFGNRWIEIRDATDKKDANAIAIHLLNPTDREIDDASESAYIKGFSQIVCHTEKTWPWPLEVIETSPIILKSQKGSSTLYVLQTLSWLAFLVSVMAYTISSGYAFVTPQTIEKVIQTKPSHAEVLKEYYELKSQGEFNN